MAEPVLVSDDGAVRTITLFRPEQRNSLDYATGHELLCHVTEAARARSVRAIVLGGTERAFCSGDDLDALERHLNGDDSLLPACRETGDAFYLRVCEEILAAGKPVIAAVSGVAVGPGTELACAADLRVGGPGTRLGCGLIRVGHSGIFAMLSRVVGADRATELYLTGRLVEAPEALRLGLLHRVAPDDEAVAATAAALAQELAEGPTRAIALFKELRERCESVPARQALRLQNQFHRRCWAEVHDSVEGTRAVLQRRRPRFSGR
ncbi:enoyl-CoA hydratase/isomerase family protein [Amycolatopsis cynarae]|uniref:Enoyl-CoA hydratase/isomerase family protein n=1 Tax=Amycolatopsis cynarae TaxID=2995223 RepID=A0ABY7AY24_9PSEU|nr:enoyl-CoA hydratase/isomerase family protein [Amycolatopsis sp. HUAS 11-8]WAL63556.1 enoyl-CoA hydratase/isomerase family protein [Amycolatopsis sp. HUAS 11-8]